jgi:hypothetical protein
LDSFQYFNQTGNILSLSHSGIEPMLAQALGARAKALGRLSQLIEELASNNGATVNHARR